MGAQDDVAAMLFERARENHLAGRMKEAEPLYRHALRLAPDYADALHMLGILLMQTGRAEPAAELIARAVELQPQAVHFVATLGSVLRQLGRADEALNCFSRAVTLRPDFVDGFSKIGVIQRSLGRPEQAAEAHREALRLQPNLYEAHVNLGNALGDLGRWEEATDYYREAVRLAPQAFEAHNNLANAFRSLGRLDEAEEQYHEALRLDPGYPEARFNLGVLFSARGSKDLAEAQFREAVHLRPDHAPSLTMLGDLVEEDGRLAEAEPLRRALWKIRPNDPASHRRLGGLLAKLGDFAEAENCLKTALQAEPDDLESLGHMAMACINLGRPGDAEACCRTVLGGDPNNANAHNNLGIALLAQGKYAEGWEEWEWRFRSWSMAARPFDVPQWAGEPMDDGTLLLHAEQGYGDTLQFCRYVPMAAERARVVLEVPQALVRLMSRLPGVARVVAAGDRLPAFNKHCPLMSLPGVFGTTLETVPGPMRYLRAEADDVAYWRSRLSGLSGLKVGLVWAGNPRKEVTLHQLADARRSVPLDLLGALLARLPDVAFVSLQKGEGAEQAAQLPPGFELHDWTAELDDFADTAALIEALDLVISVDTSVAHLAGALGKPVWLLNRFDSCWRWLRDRTDSPWYPTLLQFRQPSLGDWDSVAAAVRAALIDVACNRLIQRTDQS